MNKHMHDTRTVGLALTVGLLILGALPWISATHIFGTLSVSGYNGNGLLPMLLVVPVAAFAWFRKQRVVGWLVVGYLVAQVAMLGYTINDVNSAGEGMVTASPGVGSILSLLLGAVVAGWLLVVERKFAQARSFETVVSG